MASSVEGLENMCVVSTKNNVAFHFWNDWKYKESIKKCPIVAEFLFAHNSHILL